jgi:hypothetical protein
MVFVKFKDYFGMAIRAERENYKKPPHIGQSFQKATTIRMLFKKPPLYG